MDFGVVKNYVMNTTRSNKIVNMYLDIALGLVIGFLVSIFSGEHSFILILFGVVAALAPDIDFIVHLIQRKGKVDHYAHEHRDLLHKPLLFSAGIGLLIGLWNPLYGIVWCLGTLWHFIHDTFDGGWGIRWFHPFYFGYFTIAPYSPKRHFRNKREQHEYATLHGNPNWLEDDYFRLNRRLITEWILLTVALVFIFVWTLK